MIGILQVLKILDFQPSKYLNYGIDGGRVGLEGGWKFPKTLINGGWGNRCGWKMSLIIVPIDESHNTTEIFIRRKNTRKGGKGGPISTWTTNIKEWTRKTYDECVRAVENRQEWRSTAANLLGADGTK